MRITQIQESELNKIIKKTLSFMARNKITITPDNYEKWFNLFIELFVKGIDLQNISPLELLGLYKEKYLADPFEELKKEKEININGNVPIKVVKEVLNQVDNCLIEVLSEMEEHCKEIEKGKDVFEKQDDKQLLLKVLGQITDKYEDLKDEIRKQHEQIEKLKEELETTREEAERDALTGVFNRKKFDYTLSKLIEKKNPFTLIIFDLDNFKQINDTFGHQAGDIVLKKVGEILLKHLRPDTPLFRIGGEEFAIILPDSCIDIGEKIAERLRQIFEQKEIYYEGKRVPLTATFGLTFYQNGDTPESICKRADIALYEGKKSGKNIVIAK